MTHIFSHSIHYSLTSMTKNKNLVRAAYDFSAKKKKQQAVLSLSSPCRHNNRYYTIFVNLSLPVVTPYYIYLSTLPPTNNLSCSDRRHSLHPPVLLHFFFNNLLQLPFLHRTHLTPRCLACSVRRPIDIVRRHPEPMSLCTLPQQFIALRLVIHAQTFPSMPFRQGVHVVHGASTRLLGAVRTPCASPADVTGWGPPGVAVCASPQQTLVRVSVAGRQYFTATCCRFSLDLRQRQA